MDAHRNGGFKNRRTSYVRAGLLPAALKAASQKRRDFRQTRICSSTFGAGLIYISLLWRLRLTASFLTTLYRMRAGIQLHPEVGALSAAKMDRRDFVKSIAAGGTAAMTGWPALAELSSRRPTPAAGLQGIHRSQAALVGAIAEQFVPKDEYPGGKEAGVVPFIDAKLAGPYGKFYVDRYQSGLKLVDEVSRKLSRWRLRILEFRSTTESLKQSGSRNRRRAGRSGFLWLDPGAHLRGLLR